MRGAYRRARLHGVGPIWWAHQLVVYGLGDSWWLCGLDGLCGISFDRTLSLVVGIPPEIYIED